jgi:hypothetical protein
MLLDMLETADRARWRGECHCASHFLKQHTSVDFVAI